MKKLESRRHRWVPSRLESSLIQGQVPYRPHADLEDLAAAAAADALQLRVPRVAHHHRVLVLSHSPPRLLLLLVMLLLRLLWPVLLLLLLLRTLGRKLLAAVPCTVPPLLWLRITPC